MKFLVSRFNPENDSAPYIQEFEVEVTRGMMLRDALLEIKRQDESFSFRHSCGEGVCGSDGVNVNGSNKLACITPVSELKEPVDMPQVQPMFVEGGVWVRPFGRLVYLMPPFVMDDDDLQTLCAATLDVVRAIG